MPECLVVNSLKQKVETYVREKGLNKNLRPQCNRDWVGPKIG